MMQVPSIGLGHYVARVRQVWANWLPVRQVDDQRSGVDEARLRALIEDGEVRLKVAVEQERARALQKFVQDVSHDLMTPITIINTSLYLARKVNSAEKQAIHLQQAEIQVKQLQKRLQEMLNMARLDRLSTGEFNFGQADVNGLLNKVVASCQASAHRKDQLLTFDPWRSLPLIWADEGQIETAFLNLLDNALCYTPPGGSITVSTRLDGEQILIEIRDTGLGIPAQDLPHIFERFYRGEAHRPQGAGVGLGLSITQRIVKAHRGHITVESREGHGTTFQIRLLCSACGEETSPLHDRVA